MATGNYINKGIYDIEYFSGSSASLFVGDVWVDEVTSISYQVSQERVPLYGYGDQLFRDVSKGQVLVQGQFSINFKEAGYLWLILQRYRRMMKGLEETYKTKKSTNMNRYNIEKIINGETAGDGKTSVYRKNETLQGLAQEYAKEQAGAFGKKGVVRTEEQFKSRSDAAASLTGYSAATRAAAAGFGNDKSVGTVEGIFETFEDYIWNTEGNKITNSYNVSENRRADNRRADSPSLNPFDIYLVYGDFASDRSNHTIQKIQDVYITGSAKQIVANSENIQEVYQFLARDIV
jgi:hypothetical protein